VRFFPLLQEEMVTIQSAYRARGADSLRSFNLVTFVKGIAQVVFPLGLGAMRKSQNIALAMELRGFSFPELTGQPRVIFRDVRLRPWDWLVMALAIVMTVIIVMLKG